MYNRKRGLWESGDPVLLNNGAMERAEGESRGTGEVACGVAKQVLLRASNSDIPPDSRAFSLAISHRSGLWTSGRGKRRHKTKDTDPEPRLIM